MEFLINIFSLLSQNLDKFFTVGLLFFSSLYLRILLQIMGQSWIKTIAHTATLSFLPILTYVITSVIAGNIALSLGMVGALSIVRFRNPVRSPLELSVYFGAITMGIAAAVSLQWLVALIGSVTMVTILLYAVNLFTKIIFDIPFFITSFTEGNALSTLNIVSNEEIEALNDSKHLTSKFVSKNEISYSLNSNSFDQLKKIEASLTSQGSIISIQINR